MRMLSDNLLKEQGKLLKEDEEKQAKDVKDKEKQAKKDKDLQAKKGSSGNVVVSKWYYFGVVLLIDVVVFCFLDL